MSPQVDLDQRQAPAMAAPLLVTMETVTPSVIPDATSSTNESYAIDNRRPIAAATFPAGCTTVAAALVISRYYAAIDQ
jgi:hypothetical protein